MQFKLIIMTVILFSNIILAIANGGCDMAVINQAKVPQVLRIEQSGGIAFLPLCSKLPPWLRDKIYAGFCNNIFEISQRTYYAPFDDTDCQGMINSPWIVIRNDQVIARHVIQSTDLINNHLIVLFYPDDFSVESVTPTLTQ